MAEQTLTMDETTPESGQFTEEEMDSLKVGQEMENQQQLAGKYATTEELEKGYIELEKKLGESQSEESTEPTEAEVDEQPVDEAPPPPVNSPEVLEKLWNEIDGGFSEDTLKQLAKTNQGTLARAYLELRLQQQNQQAPELSDGEVSSLKDSVGGEETYEQMMAWAGDNLTEEEQNMYDEVVDSGNATACYFAIQNLLARYKDNIGVDGSLIAGRAPSNSANTYRSQAELVQAMADPRYDNDPAYRRDVMQKLDRSEVNF
jgi:hypothetical protein